MTPTFGRNDAGNTRPPFRYLKQFSIPKLSRCPKTGKMEEQEVVRESEDGIYLRCHGCGKEHGHEIGFFAYTELYETWKEHTIKLVEDRFAVPHKDAIELFSAMEKVALERGIIVLRKVVKDCAPKAVFRLKRFWEIDGVQHDLYADIKAGVKTSEYREANDYWCRRLLGKGFIDVRWGRMPLDLSAAEGSAVDLTKDLIVKRAWFTVGYPKGNLPRLEADITELLVYGGTAQFEINFTNVKEVTT